MESSISDQTSGLAVVLGCTGFVGSWVTKVLLESGWSVRGGCREPEQSKSWCNINSLAPSRPGKGQTLDLFSLKFPISDKDNLENILGDDKENGEQVKAVFFCVGHEKQEASTVDFMVNSALATLEAAKNIQNRRSPNSEKIVVVLTSSTGSTNKPGADPSWKKNEIEAWSDPIKQQAAGKHSPAAKTLMEQKCLQFIGRDLANNVVDVDTDKLSPRLCIINPSLILAPAIKPGGTGQALPWFGRIVKGEAMAGEIPNDSMSIIHCEDLARIHVACCENKDASGRYFGLVQSWPWTEILGCIKSIRKDKYTLPPVRFTDPAQVTQFQFSRRDKLLEGAFGPQFQLKGLMEILSSTITWMEEKSLV